MIRNTWRRRSRTALSIVALVPVLCAFAVLKHVVPLRLLARWAWRDPEGDRDPNAERLAIQRIVKIRKLFPRWDGHCLQNSLMLYRELSYAGANPVLFVGFRRTGERLQGHAWVVTDGAIVADTASDTAEFLPMFAFTRRGQLLTTRPR